jgi:anti-anti-sigma regulatory factor
MMLDENEAQFSIRLVDEVNIAQARELKNLLLQGLASGRDVRVEVGGVTQLDVTALQLLLAAERNARKSGTGFAVEGKLSEEVSAALADAGFNDFPALMETK